VEGSGTLKAGTVTSGQGLLYCTGNNVIVRNISIDMAAQSRTGIALAGNYCTADNVKISNILSDDTGTDSESGIVVTGDYCRILQPMFNDILYGTSTNGSCPRCVSVQGGAYGTHMSGMYGEDINVGVTVGLATSTTIHNTIFRKMNDNGFYILANSNNTRIQSGLLEDTEEAFVLGGTDVTVSDFDVVDPGVVCGFQQGSGTIKFKDVRWHFTNASTGTPSVLRSRPNNETYTAGYLTEYTPSWVSSTSFTYPADLTAVFYVGRNLTLTGSTSGTNLTRVADATYNGSVTTITLEDAVLDSSTETISSVTYNGTRHLVLEGCVMDVRLNDSGMIVHNNGELDWLEIHNCDFRPHFTTYTGTAATYYWYTGSGGTVNRCDASNNKLRLFNDTTTSLSGKIMRFSFPTVTKPSSWRDSEAILDTVDGVTAYIQNVLQQNVWVGANGRLNNNTNYLRERELDSPDGHKLIYSSVNPATASPTAWFSCGDIAFNIEPAVGDPAMWRCVLSGRPGQWEAIAGEGTALADATGWTDATAQANFNALLAQLRAVNVLKDPSPSITTSVASATAGASAVTPVVTP